jgi:hypothetical protein
VVGFNLAALQYVRRDWEAAASAFLLAAPADLNAGRFVKRTKMV